MANPLRKTMVYLGLADEEFEYEACRRLPAGSARRAAARPAEDRTRARDAPPPSDRPHRGPT